MSKLTRALYLSTRDLEHASEKSFWHDLNSLVKSGVISTIGFSPLTPYGLAYESKKFENWTYDTESADLIVNGISEMATECRNRLSVSLWCSILYNSFLPMKYSQINARGKQLEYMCPNARPLGKMFTDLFVDIFAQRWMQKLKRHSKRLTVTLDALNFIDEDSCFCDYCSSEFRHASGVSTSDYRSFRRRFPRNQNPVIYAKWADFRRRSTSAFVRTLASCLRSVGYRGDVACFYKDADTEPTTPLTSAIKYGYDCTDILAVNGVDPLLVEIRPMSGFSDVDMTAANDLRYWVAYLRGVAMERSKSVCLAFRTITNYSQVGIAEGIADSTGICEVLYTPFSSRGTEEILDFLKSATS